MAAVRSAFDEAKFAGLWWEIARLYNQPSAGACTAPLVTTGLKARDFGGHALQWNFVLKNPGYYSLTLNVYDESGTTLETSYRGIALVKNGKISLSLYDNGEAVELGTFSLLSTDYSSLALLG